LETYYCPSFAFVSTPFFIPHKGQNKYISLFLLKHCLHCHNDGLFELSVHAIGASLV